MPLPRKIPPEHIPFAKHAPRDDIAPKLGARKATPSAPVKAPAAKAPSKRAALPAKPLLVERTPEVKTLTPPEGYKVPTTLAACADALYKTRERRLAAQKVADGIEEEEKFLKEYLIQNLSTSLHANGISGKLARVQKILKEVPQVADWPVLQAYIKRTGSFDLLQKRLSDGAVKERWDAKKAVPGVTKFTAVTLSVTKV